MGRRKEGAVVLENVDQVVKALSKIQKNFDVNTRRNIAKHAAPPVVRAVRSRVPVRRRRYKNRDIPTLMPKYIRGTYQGHYYPGNLRRSITVLDKELKRTPYIYVGNKRTRNAGPGPFGASTATANGWYAQMIYGSAARFRQRVLIPARRRASAESLNLMVRKTNQIINQFKQRNGFG